jgi:VWFA-related protein
LINCSRYLAAEAAGCHAAVGLVAGVIATQEPREQVPTFRAGVSAVLVDVLATDREGNPLAGLMEEDFQVFEDGVPQAIATFDVTDWTSYVAGHGSEARPEGGVNTYPRRFIFVLNRQGADFEYLNRAKRDLATFIVESMAEGDESMVIDIGYSMKIQQTGGRSRRSRRFES